MRHLARTIAARKGQKPKTQSALSQKGQPRTAQPRASSREAEAKLLEQKRGQVRPRMTKEGQIIPGKPLSYEDEMDLIDLIAKDMGL